MSSQTIRDVVIKVAIENGKMKLGPVDTSEVQRQIDELQKSYRTAFSGASFGGTGTGTGTGTGSPGFGSSSGIGQSAAQAVARTKADLDKIVSEIQNWHGTTYQQSAIKIGRVGYGQSVRDRASDASREQMDFATRSGLTDNLSVADRERLRKKLESGAASSIRENDREHANSANDAKRAADEAHAAVVRFTKGLGQLAASVDKDAESMVRRVVQIEGIANVANSATTALGLTGTGLAVLAAELLATKVALDQTTATNRRYHESITNDATRMMNFHSAAAVRHSNQASFSVASMHDSTPLFRLGENFQRMNARESQIRAFEAGNASPELKRAFRERTESQGILEERRTGIDDAIAFKKQQQAQLTAAEAARKQAADNLGTFDKKTQTWSQGSARNAVRAAQDEVNNSLKESSTGFWGRQAYRAATGPISMLGINMGVDKSGYLNSQMDAQGAAKERLALTQSSALEASKDLEDRATKNVREQRDLQEEITKLTNERLYTNKEIAQSAYQALHSERERVKGAEIGFGTSEVSTQHQILRLQKKHDAIEAAKAENRKSGKSEDANLPRFNQFEMSHLYGSGSVADVTMREQAVRDAKSKGFRPETDLEDREKRFKEVMAKDTTDNDLKKLKGEAIDSRRLGQDLGEAVKSAINVTELLEGFKLSLEALRSELQDAQMKRNSFF